VRPMNRAAGFLLLLCSCTLRAPRSSATACSSSDQCNPASVSSSSPGAGSANVCFLGECRGHSAQLSVVAAEVRPTTDSPFPVSQVAGLNLQQSLVQNLVLVAQIPVSGTIAQQQDVGTQSVLPNTVITFTNHAPAIADRVQHVSTQTNNSGVFAASLPQGAWDVLVQPPQALPPFRTAQPFFTSTSFPPLLLPAVGSLVSVQGTVSAGGADLSGASITATDAAGVSISVPTQVSPGNGYSLFLPPLTSLFFVEVGPPASPDGSPAPATLATLPNYDHVPGTSSVVLPLPEVTTLSGTVFDIGGVALASVPVYARSTSDEPWTLARSATTDSNGNFSLVLRAGTYLVEAAPSLSQTAGVSPVQTIQVPLQPGADGGLTGTGLAIVCPPKLHRTGVVQTPFGKPGASYQVTATRLADPLLISRSQTTTTDKNGAFELAPDPGTYRLEITPPANTGLPLRVVQIVVDSAAPDLLDTIVIDQPLSVVGTVHGTPTGGKDTPVAGATVSFFAFDTSGASVLLGSALTDQNGSYTCILPDIANP
jgi:hypothetical protein